MCRELEALRQSIAGYARSFDSASLIPSEAAGVVAACAAIEASVSTVKSLAAAVMADGGSWRHEGYRSAEEQLADRTGTGAAAARRALQTGRRLAEQPEVARAALAGELSGDQVALVAAGVEADSTKAAELMAKAKGHSVGELREEVAQVRAARVDLEEQRRRIHAARRLRKFVDLEGVWHLLVDGNVEDGVTVMSVLTPVRQRLDQLRRDSGQQRQTMDQLHYDALMALAAIACGRDGELTLADLLDLGLFSQLESTLDRLPAPDPTLARALPAPCPARPDAIPPASLFDEAPHSGAPATAPTAPPPSTPIPADADRPSPMPTPPGADPAAGLQPSAGPSLLHGLSPSDRPVSHRSPSGPHLPQPPSGALRPVVPIPSDSPQTAPGEHRAGPDRSDLGPSGPVETRKRPRKLAGRPVQLIVRVDLDTLLRGVPIDGELCEIAGYGPVPVSVIKELTANQSTFVSAVLTKGKALSGVYRYGRRPDVTQQTALDFLYPSCAARGCNRKAGLEYEHRVEWQRTHYTVYDLMDRLCWFHHQKKTNEGWNLVEGIGKRAFVAPSDPRHPKHTDHPKHPYRSNAKVGKG
ncbi:MAG: hypothetical protein M0Z30_11795 [Actinomycetota bacterium]|nr:hypothetical protein [Actinomycetota bacterium]